MQYAALMRLESPNWAECREIGQGGGIIVATKATVPPLFLSFLAGRQRDKPNITPRFALLAFFRLRPAHLSSQYIAHVCVRAVRLFYPCLFVCLLGVSLLGGRTPTSFSFFNLFKDSRRQDIGYSVETIT